MYKMLKKDIDWLLRDKYGGKETAAFWRDVERLKRGEHVDYVIGWTNFLGCKIDLSARPLIPRPETEYWTEKAAADMPSGARVLDIFCGSGCIGSAILKRVPGTRVDFADIEPAYFPGIRRGLRWNGIAPRRAHCIASDIFKNVPGKYDYIFANPPYIPTSGSRVARSVLRQEPQKALFAGKDGLRYIRPLIRSASSHLRREGKLAIEFHPPQKKEIGALACQYGYAIRFHKDQYGRFRWAILQKTDTPPRGRVS